MNSSDEKFSSIYLKTAQKTGKMANPHKKNVPAKFFFQVPKPDSNTKKISKNVKFKKIECHQENSDVGIFSRFNFRKLWFSEETVHVFLVQVSDLGAYLVWH